MAHPSDSMTPLLAAALVERGQVDHRSLPMVSARWIAEGHDGEALLELASLNGDEREVTELWPRALAELGAASPSARRRAVMAWGVALVLSGDRDLRWLTRLIWPDATVAGDPTSMTSSTRSMTGSTGAAGMLGAADLRCATGPSEHRLSSPGSSPP